MLYNKSNGRNYEQKPILEHDNVIEEEPKIVQKIALPHQTMRRRLLDFLLCYILTPLLLVLWFNDVFNGISSRNMAYFTLTQMLCPLMCIIVTLLTIEQIGMIEDLHTILVVNDRHENRK